MRNEGSFMTITKKDIEDVKLAKFISVMDVWDIDDRIDRLEDVTCRLEKITEILLALYHEERVKNWELILKEMLRKQLEKRGTHGNRTG